MLLLDLILKLERSFCTNHHYSQILSPLPFCVIKKLLEQEYFLLN